MIVFHRDAGASCASCDQKLVSAHADIAAWFRRLKAEYVNVHIAWAYRGLEDQEKAYAEGKSPCHYPDSKHNHREGALPCSLALDLFQIDEDGVARFSYPFYAAVASWNDKNLEPILWGGNFKKRKDPDHFEMKV